MPTFAAISDFATAAAARRTLVAGTRYFEAAILVACSSFLDVNASREDDSGSSPLETGAADPWTLGTGVRYFEGVAVTPRSLVLRVVFSS